MNAEPLPASGLSLLPIPRSSAQWEAVWQTIKQQHCSTDPDDARTRVETGSASLWLTLLPGGDVVGAIIVDGDCRSERIGEATVICGPDPFGAKSSCT